ncbi:MAG TPA: GNAT family N-acetyltransferase [Roseiflexaceae bacterium]|nr:GNAT family N-acetyltransferase [Roseiflexaceae bacterium]
MPSQTASNQDDIVSLRPVDKDNWRFVAKLKVSEEQRAFVVEPTYYLTMCCYSEIGWKPLAIYAGDQVIGMLMWAIDPADGSCWLGGVMIDQNSQGRGYGTRALKTTLDMLRSEHGHRHFALSYEPKNLVAKHIYSSLGFVETDEWDGDEIVARITPSDE